MSDSNIPKAVEEVAKTGGKAIDFADKLSGFVAKVVGESAEQLGGIAGDWMQYFRYTNLLKISDRVNAIHTKRRIEGKTIPIPPRLAIPLLQSASLEDRETIQAMWSRLIANGMDPNYQESIHPGYVEVITQISADEALIIAYLNSLDSKFGGDKDYARLFETHDIVGRDSRSLGIASMLRSGQTAPNWFSSVCTGLPLSQPDKSRTYFDNLLRLKIIEHRIDIDDIRSLATMMRAKGRSAQEGGIERSELLQLTEFGRTFVRLCVDGPKDCEIEQSG